MRLARDILNRARWSTEDLHTLAITVVHRGAPNDQRTLSGARVLAIEPGGIALTPEAPGETVFVPYHRFVAIHAADGTLLWDRHGHATRTSAAGAQGAEVSPTFEVVLPGEELTLDGSAGEGGGQILRTALALSMITGRPFVLDRVRARRKKPGLMRQHLTAVRAAAAVCAAEVEGDELGSGRLVFRPQALRGGDFEFDVGSAGSTSLVLQTVALPLALAPAPSRVVVRGGTHARWAPIYPFLEQAWLPHVNAAGARIALTLRQPGFYPAGGGEVRMTSEPSTLAPLHLAPPATPSLTLTAVVANLPEEIAHRELTRASALLAEEVTLHSATLASRGPGNAVWVTAHAPTGTNVFSALGERGVPAEEVGASCARAFLRWRATHTSVEEHLADQLMLPIAVAGEGSYTCSDLTLHSRTNIEVIHAFTHKRLRAYELESGGFQVRLRP